MPFVARGVIRHNGHNDAREGQHVFVAEPTAGTYQWDGEHRAKVYATAAEALAAAAQCIGPWFNLPKARSVRAVSYRASAKPAK